jgi:hypothetical protein
VLQKSIEKTIVLWKLCYKDSQSVLELLLGAIMQQTGASVSSDWYRSGDLSSYKSLTLSASVRIPVQLPVLPCRWHRARIPGNAGELGDLCMSFE